MEPYELPREFRGFVIAEIVCAVCEKRFITTISLDNFLGHYGGSFMHYRESGGCGSWYSIIGSKDSYIIARVFDKREGGKPKDVVAFLVAIGETGNPISPEIVGWKHSP
jgi:hypothetical protein